MVYFVVFFAAAAAGLLVVGFANLMPNQTRVVQKRLAVLQAGAVSYRELQERRRRQQKRERMEAILAGLGSKVSQKPTASQTRQLLMHAGFKSPQAPTMLLGIQVTGAALGVIGGLTLGTVAGAALSRVLFLTAVTGLIGWSIPRFIVSGRARRRQDELRVALPDTLDLMVVCVEAGLALNQAIVRVAEEIDRVSPVMAEELTIVNLEIRAGTPRDEALRHFSERTGVEDIKALVSMLLQTDRFGTSIADALRVHSDVLRTKRRQRAEEAAAKLTVKLLFPLILFVFPAFFVVLLGPSLFLLRGLFGGG
ncbi:MAG: type II secretion system F family protein [Gemmatimonadota bacterium]|nr:MAG: type II secretion system F family protein [Gemmatimonadota bacterium]